MSSCGEGLCASTTPSTAVHRVCKDMWLHPVWGEEAPGGWCEAAAGNGGRLLGCRNPRGPGLLTRGKVAAEAAVVTVEDGKVSSDCAAAPFAQKGLIKVRDN